jgi:hypothetical protein
LQGLSWKLGILLSSFLLFGCQRPAPMAADHGAGRTAATEPAAPPDAVPHGREADDAARFLAGLPGTPGSSFSTWEDRPAWQRHRQLLDALWATADSKLIRSLREFQRNELAGPPFDQTTVFYPFSGPDVLTATLCFPRSPVYLMVALEPAGSLPSARQLARKPLAQYLGAVRTTVASELGKSFFVTREMDRQFRGQVTDGLMVPILLLLVRTGQTILGLRYVRLNEQGQIVERPPAVPVAGEFANKGLEVEFRSADNSTHKLYYFSVNLSNRRLSGNWGFLHYVTGMPAAVTMLKATSYMLHHAEFSTIRDLVVNHSEAVFQDDSGIPYHCFRPDQWSLQLYGEYTRPYGSFRWFEQTDLRQAYLTRAVKPLTMRLGYGFGKVASNLLLAKRLHPAPKRPR